MKKPSLEDENSFMDQLLSGFDSSIYTGTPQNDSQLSFQSLAGKTSAQNTGIENVDSKTETFNSCYNSQSLSSDNLNEVPNLLRDNLVAPNSNISVNREPLSERNNVITDAESLEISTMLAGAENWDWSDVLSPVKAKSEKRKTVIKKETEIKTYIRCVVRSTSFITSARPEKHLQVDDIKDGKRILVILHDEWQESNVQVGDIVNVIGAFSEEFMRSSTITISSKQNLLIIQPDILLTATSIANAPQCLRRPVLSGLTRSNSDITPALVWGNILHEVMQSCLDSGRWDKSYIDECIDKALHSNLGELVKLSFAIDSAKLEIKARAQGLLTFGQRFIGKRPKADARLIDTRESRDSSSTICITRLRDIEEDIWSPKYGIKGKIDASIEAIVAEHNNKQVSEASWTMPLEIKTGRSVAGMEHRAQTILYTLIMEERYGLSIPSGLLYYTQNSELFRVSAGRNEIKALIMARNELASFVASRLRPVPQMEVKTDIKPALTTDYGSTSKFMANLPPAIDDEWICKKCYSVDACMLYRKATNPITDNLSPVVELYNAKTSHLSDAQISFFKHWETLISLEEQDMVQLRKEIWTMGSQEREAKGRCWSSMILDKTFRSSGPIQSLKDNKIHRYTYKFRRLHPPLGSISTISTDLLKGSISVGDAIVISVEPHILALVRGFVTHLSSTEVTVGVDHSIDEVTLMSLNSQLADKTPMVFRIDKDELTSGMARVRDNLARMFYAGSKSRLLELIVDLEKPQFDESASFECLNSCQDLNLNQQQAIERVLQGEDYSLILGMPGTGKTTTIAELIRILVHMGKTVLLTSYTHSAVDTILLKLKSKVDFDILRVGNADKVHPDIHPFMLNALPRASTIEELEAQLLKPAVVATTCLSIDHALFSRRRFDYCIVDEASQITLPTCLGPLRFANKFVLVGDHFQLPPLVKSRAARNSGFEISLFRHLCDAHPNAVTELARQYRMCSDIMFLSNKLIYNNRLICGSEAVAQQSLFLPHLKKLRSLHGHGSCQNACWIPELAKEMRKAVFVDTDAMGAKDSRVGDLVQNETEGHLIQQLVDGFLEGGLSEEQIGIITPYRQQIKFISHLLQQYKRIEILTADQSQGKDKDCILISLVRSNETGQVGDLMKDWRRMNVTFTRARKKLIIFGSRTTLQQVPLLAEFFIFMDEKGWIFSLPQNAGEQHARSTLKRRVDRNEEEQQLKTPKKTKKTKIGDGSAIFKGRPVLRDVLNGI